MQRSLLFLQDWGEQSVDINIRKSMYFFMPSLSVRTELDMYEIYMFKDVSSTLQESCVSAGAASSRSSKYFGLLKILFIFNSASTEMYERISYH